MIERWGVLLPEAENLPALPKGVVLHWTAGGPRASREDLAAYHYIVEQDGTVRSGVHPVAANMRQLRADDAYAQHTGGFNSFRVGLSACGMRGYRSRESPGDYPLTSVQINRLCELAAYFVDLGGLDPSNPRHLCTHQEVWTIHGIKGTRNHLKLDIEYLPPLPHLEEHETGPYLRHLTAEVMAVERREPAAPEVVAPHLATGVPLDLTKIDVPASTYIDAILRERRLSQAAVREGLEVAEAFARGVLAGRSVGEAGLRALADALADWLGKSHST